MHLIGIFIKQPRRTEQSKAEKQVEKYIAYFSAAFIVDLIAWQKLQLLL